MTLKELLDSYNIEGSEYYEIEISTNKVKFGWKGKYPFCALSSDLLYRAVNNWGIDSQKREIFIILEDNQ